MLYRLCQILAACEKLTSVSILGESEDYDLTQLWKSLPGLTTVKIPDGHLVLKPLLQMEKLRELSIDGDAVADLRNNAANKPDKVEPISFSAILDAVRCSGPMDVQAARMISRDFVPA